MNRIVLGMCVALAMSGCGGGDTSLTDYTESIDAIFARGLEQYETLIDSPEGMVLIVGQGEHLGFDTGGAVLTDFTPEDLHIALVQVAEIQKEALDSAAEIDPPDELAEIHALYFRELPIAQLAERAGTASDWQELSDSPEMEAYRTALASDNDVCAEFQARLDATAARGVFADSPWIPGDLKETVNYALGCDALPANPEDVYRP